MGEMRGEGFVSVAGDGKEGVEWFYLWLSAGAQIARGVAILATQRRRGPRKSFGSAVEVI